MLSTADLMKAAMAEIESKITKKTPSVEVPQGGVTVRFERTPEGRLSVGNL